jgi:asparagine synthase (glutamine-hydrolysing)
VCGIAGFEAPSRDLGAAAASSLLASLHTRGPDGAWILERPPYWFVQTRLSVIDLSDRVVYPMPNEDDSVWLLFNGEIYEYETLRRRLEAAGHRFRTTCDAEVVLHGYEEWGIDVFGRLNGMFAVALWDERQRELVLARDRLGIKPLVRTTVGPFAFSSDALSLVATGLNTGDLDEAAMREYATFQYVPPPRTGIEAIEQVEPGTVLVRGVGGGERVERWATTPFSTPPAREGVDIDEAEQIIRQAVARQLVADVDVGIFLSGGVDSALVLAYAVDAGARPHTFTVGFPGQGDYDESTRAARLARYLGVPHETETLSGSFSEAIAGIASAFDLPFGDSSALPTLAVARLAGRQLKVALSGTGGDDLFAGYYRHRIHRLRPVLSVVPSRLLVAAAGTTSPGRERQSGRALARSYLRRLADAGARTAIDQYLALVGSTTSAEARSTLRFSLDPRVVRAGVARRFGLDGSAASSQLRGLQRFELKTYLPGDLLAKEDRATMAVGLESRVPLLDNEVIGLATVARDRQKVSWIGGKLLLRHLALRRLGGTHGSVRKRGFAVPLAALFDGAWRREAQDWFSAANSELVDGVRAAQLASSGSSSTDLWALGALIAWEGRLRTARGQSDSRVLSARHTRRLAKGAQ